MHHRLRKIRNVRRWQRLNRLIRFRRDERGVQLVEVAIVIPILLLLFGAVGEFGRYFYEYTTVAKAARVGARFMASKSLNSADVNWQLKTQNLVVYGNTDGTGSPVLSGLTIANVKLSYAGGSYADGEGTPATVTVSIIDYTHQPIFDLGKLTNSSLSLAVDVKPSVTMHYMLNSGSI